MFCLKHTEVLPQTYGRLASNLRKISLIPPNVFSNTYYTFLKMQRRDAICLAYTTEDHCLCLRGGPCLQEWLGPCKAWLNVLLARGRSQERGG